MKKGYLYQKTEEEVNKDLKDGQEVTAGMDLDLLLNTIIVYEINASGDPAQVLSALKQDIMIRLGKVEPKKE